MKFKIGDSVRKRGNKGQWHGKIVGTYSTECTPIGYAVESVYEANSVQIYPESALEPWDATQLRTAPAAKENTPRATSDGTVPLSHEAGAPAEPQDAAERDIDIPMTNKNDSEAALMPDEIWCRALLSAGNKQLACVRPESPLIQDRAATKMQYTKYTRAAPPPASAEVEEAFDWLRKHVGRDYLNNKQRIEIEKSHEKLDVLSKALKAAQPDKLPRIEGLEHEFRCVLEEDEGSAILQSAKAYLERME